MVEKDQRYRSKATGIVVTVLNRKNDHVFIQYPGGSASGASIRTFLDAYELIEEENVTEFKPGDKVRLNGARLAAEVLATDGEWAWVKGDSFHTTIKMSGLEPVPDFFEVGKTYQNPKTKSTLEVIQVSEWNGIRYAIVAYRFYGQEAPQLEIRLSMEKIWTEV